MEKQLYLGSRGVSLVTVLLGIIYISPLLLVVNPAFTKISSLIIIGISIFLFQSEKFYFILPIFIFFNTDLLLPGDLSTYRVYSLLLFLKIIFSNKLKIEKAVIIQISIILLYCALVIAYNDFKLSLLVIFDLVLIIFYITAFIRNNISTFFTYYIFGAFTSCLYGYAMKGLNLETYVFIDNQWVEVTRFVGSFIDPNYLGFFLNIAILSIIVLDIVKNKTLKIGLLIFFYASLLSTLSITGYFCNVVMLSIYFILQKKVNIKYFAVLVVVGLFLYTNLNVFANADYPVISDMAKRITSKSGLDSSNDLSTFTTGRSSIWMEHLAYFTQQPLINILFGGNYVTDAGRDPNFSHVSHQSYIDMLLNFGLIGTLVMLFFFLRLTLHYVITYMKTNYNEFLLLVLVKFIWMFYAFGLSMFPSWTFNIFFFL